MDPRLQEFIRLFNTKQFFDSHEVLEDLWIETEGDDKNFYKGLIQCAVAFVHLQRNNLRGATKLHRTACGYLNNYLPAHGSVNTGQLMRDFDRCFWAIVKRAETSGSVEDIGKAETPIIRLMN